MISEVSTHDRVMLWFVNVEVEAGQGGINRFLTVGSSFLCSGSNIDFKPLIHLRSHANPHKITLSL